MWVSPKYALRSGFGCGAAGSTEAVAAAFLAASSASDFFCFGFLFLAGAQRQERNDGDSGRQTSWDHDGVSPLDKAYPRDVPDHIWQAAFAVCALYCSHFSPFFLNLCFGQGQASFYQRAGKTVYWTLVHLATRVLEDKNPKFDGARDSNRHPAMVLKLRAVSDKTRRARSIPLCFRLLVAC